MSPMNNDNRKDYQTVLEEQTPLVCNDAVENKSSSTRLVTLLSIGIAVFAFLAMAGQHVSHANSISELKFSHGNSISELKLSHSKSISDISELKAALADHQSQLQTLTVQRTPLLGVALQGTSAVGDLCAVDNDCGTGVCDVKPYATCVEKPKFSEYTHCRVDAQCESDYCEWSTGWCKDKWGPGGPCTHAQSCLSGICPPEYDGGSPYSPPTRRCA